MKKQSGFTLVELMIVMAIIAILATAGISAYTEYLKKARDTTRVQIASQVNTAVTALMSSNGGVPPTDEALIAELDTMNMSAAMEALEVGNPRYLSSVSSVMEGIGNVVGIPTLSALIDEPSGGKAICLGYTGGEIVGGQSCAFRYIVYGDNTYVVGYGIEHESNMQKNFYKIATTAVGTNSGTPQYMQVVGTAEYVGLPSIGEVGGPAKPDTTNPFGASKITIDGSGAVTQPDFTSEIVVANSATLSDETTGGGGGGGGGLGVGEACSSGSGCASGYCIFSICSATPGQNGDGCPSPGDTTCDVGLICSANGGWCTNGEAGSICIDDTECDQGNHCTPGGLCEAGGTLSTGAPCTSGSECISGVCGFVESGAPFTGTLVCRATGTGAIGDVCSYTGADCQSGYCTTSTYPATCTSGENGESCYVGYTACKSGFCINFTCSATPGQIGDVCGQERGDCASTYCGMGQCTTGAIGQPCDDGLSSCQSGYCSMRFNYTEGHPDWTPVCTSGGPGEPCNSNQPYGSCAPELSCLSNICSTGNVGASCSSDADCPVTGYCDTNSSQCANP